MIHHGDLFNVLPTIAAESVDACVTDPPYGIGFMGKEWDTFKPEKARELHERGHSWTKRRPDNPNLNGRKRQPSTSPSQIEYDYTNAGLRGFQDWTARWAAEVYRVLKPGAYIVVCGAPRSYHRMACGLEDAGFVVRDNFAWLFGSGFPKNYNLGDGKGTALKPAHEPIALAWKPFKGSIKACHEKHGTAALNIDDCRVGDDDTRRLKPASANTTSFPHSDDAWQPRDTVVGSEFGRWPANVVMDEQAAAVLDEQAGDRVSGHWPTDRGEGGYEGGFTGQSGLEGRTGSIGGASRFYYVAKPSREERDMGCYDLQPRQRDDSRKDGNPGGDNPRNRGLQPRGNFHPTVKPVELMRWLVRLVTPINGTALDPFLGSGTTAMACVYEQRQFIGIERESEYIEIAKRRIASVAPLFTESA
jgi:DNA modification methylase